MKNFEIAFIPPEIEKGYQKIKLLNGLQVAAAGYFPEASGHNFKRDFDKFTVAIFCTAGKGYYEYKNKIWEVNAGEILYCWHGTTHHYWADKDKPWTIFWLHIQGKEVDLLLKEVNIDANNPVLSTGISHSLILLFREILDTMKKKFSLINAIYVSTLAKQILSTQLFLLNEKNKPMEENHQFNEILKFLSDHLKESLTIAAMSKHCHLSETYFIRKFKQKYGYSPLVYFNRLKIETASHLLLMSDRSIKEISFSLGFEDPLYFSRLFRKVTKQSPTEYRESH